MTAPSPTSRSTPSGIPLPRGYQMLVTFAADTDVSLWEKAVQPPGVDGGEPIATTTQHNTAYRTFVPRVLKTLTPHTFTAAYDPGVYTQIIALVNVGTTITITFSDGSTVAFYGFLQKFEPAQTTEENQPEATVTVVPTNWDPTSHVEAGPAVSSVAGT